jgi:hypothetical protein
MENKTNIFNKFIVIGSELRNKLFELNFFFLNFHVPLVVLVLYFVSFALLHSNILSIPNGVTYVFVSRSWKFISLLAIGNSLILLAIIKFQNGGRVEFKKSTTKLSRGDFILLLLPLTPVVQYIINNQDILSPLGSLYVFGLFLLLSGFYVFVIPTLFSFVVPTRTLLLFGLAFVYTITNMALLSQSFSWYESGRIEIQMVFLGGVFLVTWFLFDLYNRKFLRFLILAVFLANSITQLAGNTDLTNRTDLPISENRLLSLIEGRRPDFTPNIYLLVYDAYVTNETMLSYGIDNSSQEEYLMELGFTLYPHTYSVDTYSTGTMSRVLNASIDFYGNKRRGVSGDGIIQNTLSSFGYKTYGLFTSNYFFRGIDPTYDFSIPERPSSPNILSRAILMGEFRFDVEFNYLPRDQFVETKLGIFENSSSKPVFIYMHSNLPSHSQKSGVCRPEERYLFKDRLKEANLEMGQDIRTIVENDPEAIIIVAGDHGPFLTKNCSSFEDYDVSEISRLDIQDRFGTFLAIRWPTEDFAIYDDITVLQDLFPAIFAYLFNDERILESRIDTTIISDVAKVRNGIIYGGIHDGEPLFITDK